MNKTIERFRKKFKHSQFVNYSEIEDFITQEIAQARGEIAHAMYEKGKAEREEEILKIIEKEMEKYDQDDMIKYDALDQVINLLKQ